MGCKYKYNGEWFTKEEVTKLIKEANSLPNQLAVDIAANYSYAVEIDKEKQPTQHYSNLTVPGGTNYTENEISTPLITPSIKGHPELITDEFGNTWNEIEIKPEHTNSIVFEIDTSEKNLFTVEPIQSADIKAKSKAKISTQYIGFAEGIEGSSTALYAKQAKQFANTGNYSSADTIFVSVGGKRGNETVRKEQQDKTIREAIKALEAGATLITDNAAYVESNSYNEGEKRLAANLKAKGYNYSETTVDGNLLGVWNKKFINKKLEKKLSELENDNIQGAYGERFTADEFDTIQLKKVIQAVNSGVLFQIAKQLKSNPELTYKELFKLPEFLPINLYGNVLVSLLQKAGKETNPEVKSTLLKVAGLLADYRFVANSDGSYNVDIVKPKELMERSLRAMRAYGFKFKISQAEQEDTLEVNEAFNNEVDSSNIDFNEEVNFINSFETTAFNLSSKVKGSTKLKIALRTIPSDEINFLGFNSYFEYDKIHSTLVNKLESITSPDVMMNKLIELKDSIPWINPLIIRLQNDQSLFNNFFSVYSNQRAKYLTSFQNKEGTHSIIVANREGVTQMLLKQWANNLLYSEVYSGSDSINTTKAKSILLEYETEVNRLYKLDKITKSELNNLSSILNKVGIILPSEDLFSMYQPDNELGLSAKQNFMNLLGKNPQLSTFYPILSSLSIGVNPYMKGLDESGQVSGEANSINRLLDVLKKSKEDLYESGILTSEGKKQYTHVNQNYFSKFVNRIKSAYDSVASFLLKDNFFRDSFLLKELAEVDNRNIFDLYYINGINQEDVNQKGKLFKDFNNFDLEVFKLNSFFNSKKTAYYYINTYSDSSSNMMLHYKKYEGKELKQKIKDLFNKELNRVKRAKLLASRFADGEIDAEYKVKNYLERGQKFLIIDHPDFNTMSMEELNNEELIDSKINEWITQRQGEYLQKLKSLGVYTVNVSKGKTTISFNSEVNTENFRTDLDNPLKNLTNAYFNDFVLSAEVNGLLANDIAYYKNTGDYFKRIKQLLSPVKLGNTTGKEFINTIYISDVEQYSAYNTNILEGLINSKPKGDNLDSAYMVAAKYGYSNHVIDGKKYSKNPKTGHIFPSLTINITDAQAYITLDRYKEILNQYGEWTPAHEVAYNRVKEANRKNEPIPEDILIMFAPQKPFVFTNVWDQETGLIVPTQEKNAEVIIDLIYHGSPKYTNLYNYMYDYGIDSVMHQSAVKVGERKVLELNEDWSNLNEAALIQIPSHDYGRQVENPPHFFEDEIKLGTQLRRLITTDLSNDIVIQVNGIKYNKQAIINRWNELHENILSEDFSVLEKEFSNIESLSKMLIDNAENRDLNEDYIKALQINPKTGKFNLSLTNPFHSALVESILFAKVRNTVTKQKVTGGSFVQVSGVGFDTKLKPIRSENGKIVEAEIMLPYYMKDILGKDLSFKQGLGFRIPTEGLHSMIAFKVVGFLPKSAGNVVMLPLEITTISGSDFDVDKLFVWFKDQAETKKAQYNNELLEIARNILLHPSNYDRAMEPGGFDSLKELAIKMEEVYSDGTKDKWSSQDMNPYLGITKTEYFLRNQAGKNLIGPAANHNVNHSIIQQLEFFGVQDYYILDTKATNLATKETQNNTLVSSSLKTFLAAFVDNPKEPVASMLNINTFTFDTVASGIRFGFDENHILNYINQPVLRKLSSLYYSKEENLISYISSVNEIQEELMNNLEGQYKAKAGKQIAEEIIDNSLLTSEQLSSNLDYLSKLNNKLDFSEYSQQELLNQLAVLQSFIQNNQVSRKIGKLVVYTRPDAHGVQTTVPAYLNYLYSYEKANEVLNISSIRGNNKLIDSFFYYGIEKPRELISSYIPWVNESVSNFTNSMLENYKNNMINEKNIKNIYSSIYNYIATSFNNFRTENKEEFINSFNEEFRDYLNNNKKTNLDILKYAAVTNSGIELFTNMFLSEDQKANIRSEIEYLLYKGSTKDQKVIRDLIKYYVLKNGFDYRVKSIISYLPIKYYLEEVDSITGLNLNDHIENEINKLHSQEYQTGFYIQFFQNKRSFELLMNVSKLISEEYSIPNTSNVFAIRLKEEVLKEMERVSFVTNGSQLFMNIDDTGLFYAVPQLGTNKEYEFDATKISFISKYKDNYVNLTDTKQLKSANDIVTLSNFQASYVPQKDDTKLHSKFKGFLYELDDAEVESKDIKMKESLLGYLSNKGMSADSFNNLGLSGLELADILTEVIKVVNNNAPTPVNNDISRVMINILGNNNPLVQRLYTVGYGSKEFDSELNNIDEIVYSKLTDYISGLENKEENNSVTNDFNSSAKYFINKIKSLFGKDNSSVIYNLVEQTYGELPKEYSDNNETLNRIKERNSKISELYELEDKPYTKLTDKLKKAAGSVLTKLSIYKSKGETTFTQAERDLLLSLKESIKFLESYSSNSGVSESDADRIKLGLTDFIDSTDIYVKEIVRLYNNLDVTNFATKDSKALEKLATTAGQANSFIKSYKEIVKEIKTELLRLANDDSQKQKPLLKDLNIILDKYRKVDEAITLIEDQKNELLYTILEKYLGKFVNRADGTAPNIKQLLRETDKDLGWSDKIVRAMSHSTDSLLQLIDIAVKDKIEIARQETLTNTRKLLNLSQAMKDSGITDTEWAYERLDGKLTGYLLSKYNLGAFEKTKQEFFDNLNKSKDTLSRKEYKKLVAQWFQSNTQPRPDVNEIIEEKKEYFFSIYNSEKAAQEAFDHWLDQNRLVKNYKGEIIIIYKNELSEPSDDYINYEYSKIIGTPKEKYLNELKSYISELEKGVPYKYQLKNAAPQHTKDLIDRMKSGINWNDLTVELSKLVHKMEDDSEFALVNEEGEIHQDIPVYFANKLKNPDKYLSTNLIDGLILYTNSLSRYKNLKELTGVIDMTKEALLDRKIYKTNTQGNKLKNALLYFKNDKQESFVENKGENNAYLRFVEYLNMNVYGEMKADEGVIPLLGWNVATTVDTLTKWVTINNLALNVYSGINNIANGTLQIKIERAAGQFVTKKSLQYADGVYISNIMNSFNNSFKNLPTDKFSSVLLKFNVQQNDHLFQGIESQGKAGLKKAFSLETMLFMNTAGEHYLSSKLGIAMISEVILKDKEGNDINLYEAYSMDENSNLILEPHYRNQFSEEQERTLGRKIAKVNQLLHGIYNDVDKNVAQKYALGRLVFQFRKYVMPGFDRRWRKKHYDEILGIEREGFYQSFGTFLKALKRDKFRIMTAYNSLSDMEKMNVHRTLRELRAYIVTAVLIGALSALRGDDSDDKIIAFTLIQLKRLKAESGFNWNPSEAIKILKEPAASVRLIDDLIDVGTLLITPWNAFDTKERGINAGRTNISVAVEKVLPLPVKSIRNLLRPQELLKNY